MVAKLAEKVAPAYNYFIVKIEGLIFGDKRFKQIWNENHHFQIRIKPFSMNLRDILWGFFCCLLIFIILQAFDDINGIKIFQDDSPF